MKTFKLEINTTLEAENIDDAFKRIGNYYLQMSEGAFDIPSIFDGGTADIYLSR